MSNAPTVVISNTYGVPYTCTSSSGYSLFLSLQIKSSRVTLDTLEFSKILPFNEIYE